jgi:hypothetical protein
MSPVAGPGPPGASPRALASRPFGAPNRHCHFFGWHMLNQFPLLSFISASIP